ncbi:MAG: helix-turn-helix domain-containing protein [Novosphingobium sp.]
MSATAVRVLKHYLLGCRSSDFEPGKICGVWEQPQTTAQTLRISTKVLHNAEAELKRGGFIERTHVPHARRSGQRSDGVIVSLAGISLRPVIDGYGRWKARLDAMELHERAVASLRHEVVMLGRQIRASEAVEAVEQADRILPRGRVSRIESIEKLEALKASLEALLVQLDLPSGDTKSSVGRKKSSHPIYLSKTHRKTVPARPPRKATLIGQPRSRQLWPPALRATIIGLCCHPRSHRAGQTLSKRRPSRASGMASPNPRGLQPATGWGASERRCRCSSSTATRGFRQSTDTAPDQAGNVWPG